MTVAYEVRERIAYISFDRPDKHNALRDQDVEALAAALWRLDDDENAALGILSGRGRSFSSGGDVADRLQRSMDEGSTRGRFDESQAFFRCQNWKPLIAAVHGYCLGHALHIALMCDHLVAAYGAQFEVTEIKVGLPLTMMLSRLGGLAFANDVCMTGRRFTAEEAWRAGVVTRVVADGTQLQAAEELARSILEHPQSAVRETVRVRRGLLAETIQRHRTLSGGFGWTDSGEARAAVAARQP